MNHTDYEYTFMDWDNLPDTLPHEPAQTPEPIDWQQAAQAMPWIICATSWLVWLAFLLLPTLYGLHGADRFPMANNIIFVLTGLVLVMASTLACQACHGVRAGLFVLVVAVLAYWF